MAYELNLDSEKGVINLKRHGSLMSSKVISSFEEIAELIDRGAPHLIRIDVSDAETTDITSQDIKNFAVAMRSRLPHDIHVAIVSEKLVNFGLCRMLAYASWGFLEENIQVFKNIELACDWLAQHKAQIQ